MLQRQGFQEYFVSIGVQLGHGFVLRGPATVDDVSPDELSGFVVQFDHDRLAEILQRDFFPCAGPETPDPIGPLFKCGVMRNASAKRDRCKPSDAGGPAHCARVPAFTMLHDLRRPLQRTDVGNAAYLLTIPFDAELEVLVRIVSRRVHGEGCSNAHIPRSPCEKKAGSSREQKMEWRVLRRWAVHRMLPCSNQE